MVSCFRYGKYYLRTRPEKVNHPDTPAQLAQRMRFGLVQAFLKPVKPFIRAGFAAEAAGRSAYSAAMSYNLLHAVEGEYPDLRLNPAKALVSRGTLPGAEGVTFTTENHRALCAWEERRPAKYQHNHAALLVVAPEHGEAVWEFHAAERSDGQASLDLPPAWQATELLAYLTFFDARWLSRPVNSGDVAESCLAGRRS